MSDGQIPLQHKKSKFTLAAMATVIKLTSECMSVKTKDCFFTEISLPVTEFMLIWSF